MLYCLAAPPSAQVGGGCEWGTVSNLAGLFELQPTGEIVYLANRLMMRARLGRYRRRTAP